MVAKPGKASLEVTRRFLDGLCQVQTQTTGENSGKPFRIYYGNGNHEQRLGREYKTYGEMYREFRRILKQRNISYLSDRSVNLSEEIRHQRTESRFRLLPGFRPGTHDHRVSGTPPWSGG